MSVKNTDKLKKTIIVDRMLDLLERANLPVNEKAALRLSQDWDIYFNGCSTNEDAIIRLHQLHLVWKLLNNSNAEFSDYIDIVEKVKDLFKGFETNEEKIERLEQFEHVQSLFDTLEIPFTIHAALSMESIFNGCQTDEDAIRRIQEMSEIAKF